MKINTLDYQIILDLDGREWLYKGPEAIFHYHPAVIWSSYWDHELNMLGYRFVTKSLTFTGKTAVIALSNDFYKVDIDDPGDLDDFSRTLKVKGLEFKLMPYCVKGHDKLCRNATSQVDVEKWAATYRPADWNGKCVYSSDEFEHLCPFASQAAEPRECTAPGGPDKCTSRHHPDFKARAHKGCPYARGGTCVF